MTHTQREISKIFESLEFSAVFVGEENTFFSPFYPTFSIGSLYQKTD